MFELNIGLRILDDRKYTFLEFKIYLKTLTKLAQKSNGILFICFGTWRCLQIIKTIVDQFHN